MGDAWGEDKRDKERRHRSNWDRSYRENTRLFAHAMICSAFASEPGALALGLEWGWREINQFELIGTIIPSNCDQISINNKVGGG
eukprot:scaffold10413_cov191-Skeletonema_marinoi.AAC.2